MSRVMSIVSQLCGVIVVCPFWLQPNFLSPGFYSDSKVPETDSWRVELDFSELWHQTQDEDVKSGGHCPLWNTKSSFKMEEAGREEKVKTLTINGHIHSK